jgi:DNA repair protein SbcD/Mre11
VRVLGERVLEQRARVADGVRAAALWPVQVAEGDVVEAVPLAPLRDVRRLRGTLAELLAAGATDPRRDDYVHAALLDPGALLDPIGRLRAAYPNTLSIERPLYDTAGADGAGRPRPGGVADAELFDAFFAYATGDDLDPDQRAVLAGVIDGLERRRREAPS